MSSTKLGRKRERDDSYPTPASLAMLICRELATVAPWPVNVLDPGCGVGTFMRAARVGAPGRGPAAGACGQRGAY